MFSFVIKLIANEKMNIGMLVTFVAIIFTAIVGFSCTFRVSKGEKYNPMLKLNTSMVFREKERKYKNIVSMTIVIVIYRTRFTRTPFIEISINSVS